MTQIHGIPEFVCQEIDKSFFHVHLSGMPHPLLLSQWLTLALVFLVLLQVCHWVSFQGTKKTWGRCLAFIFFAGWLSNLNDHQMLVPVQTADERFLALKKIIAKPGLEAKTLNAAGYPWPQHWVVLKNSAGTVACPIEELKPFRENSDIIGFLPSVDRV